MSAHEVFGDMDMEDSLRRRRWSASQVTQRAQASYPPPSAASSDFVIRSCFRFVAPAWEGRLDGLHVPAGPTKITDAKVTDALVPQKTLTGQLTFRMSGQGRRGFAIRLGGP